MKATLTIARKELKDVLKSDWLLGYTVLFAVLALTISYLGQRNLGGLGFEGFSRTTASLLNLSLLLTPLVGLAAGAGAIAGMRDHGSLSYLLAQPVRPLEVLVGKYMGQVTAIGLATIAGFGMAGIVIAMASPAMSVGFYLLLLGLVIVLSAVMVGIGLLVSVMSRDRGQAIGIVIGVWFFFVLFFDLVLVGMVSSSALGGAALLTALLANPVEVVRLLMVLNLDSEMTVLGPFGAYLMDSFGASGATVLLSVAMLVWLLVPLGVGSVLFRNPNA